MSAAGTDKRRLALAAFSINHSTLGACLGRVGGIDFDKRPAVRFQLVGQHGFDIMPANVQYFSVQSSLAPPLSSHVFGLEGLDHNATVAANQVGCTLMLPITAHSCGLGSSSSHSFARFSVSSRPLFTPRQTPSSPSSLQIKIAEGVRGAYCLPIRACHGDCYTPVNANAAVRFRLNNLNGRRDGDEPSIATPVHSGRPYGPAHSPTITKLYETKFRYKESRPFGVVPFQLTIDPLYFEARVTPSIAEPGIATLLIEGGERLIEIPQSAMQATGRNVTQPIKFLPQHCNLLALRNKVQRTPCFPFILPPKIAALLKRQIINTADAISVMLQHLGLLVCGVKPVLEGANNHVFSIAESHKNSMVIRP